jgi:hypothetical protein
MELLNLSHPMGKLLQDIPSWGEHPSGARRERRVVGERQAVQVLRLRGGRHGTVRHVRPLVVHPPSPHLPLLDHLERQVHAHLPNPPTLGDSQFPV